MSDGILEIKRHGHPRRATRPAVEVLGPRRLPAVNLTITTLAVPGVAGSPLVAMNPLFPGSPQAGQPIPLVLIEGGISVASGAYSGTVDWGDGSPAEPISTQSYTGPPEGDAGAVLVEGPAHTYLAPGTFAITVSLTESGQAAVYHPTVTIAPAAPRITGGLNPLSDSGLFNFDALTNVSTPNFLGTTEPGATVTLTATSSANPSVAVPVGSGVADSNGAWSITSAPLADGSYRITASVVGTSGATASKDLLGGPSLFPNRLIITHAGPQIEGFTILDGRRGTFQVTFRDPNGLLVSPLTVRGIYTVSRVPSRGQALGVTGLTRTPIPDYPVGYTTDPVVVTGRLGKGRAPNLRNGSVDFSIRGDAILDIAGNSLDGEYAGRFPTGDGQAGGDFRVRVRLRNGRQVAIAPAPAPVQHRAVHPRHG